MAHDSACCPVSLLWGLGIGNLRGSVRLPFRESSSDHPNPDQTSGYYATTPARPSFCATHSTSQCADVATDQIPATFQSVVSNPVGVAMKDLTSGLAYLVNSDGSGNALKIDVDMPTGKLSLIGSSGANTFWLDASCTIEMFLQESGALTRYGTSTVSTTGLTVIGGMQLKVQMIQEIKGDCAHSFSQVHDCYLDPLQCGGSDNTENLNLQTSVKGLLDPYINAGVMSLSDLPNLKTLAYELNYN